MKNILTAVYIFIFLSCDQEGSINDAALNTLLDLARRDQVNIVKTRLEKMLYHRIENKLSQQALDKISDITIRVYLRRKNTSSEVPDAVCTIKHEFAHEKSNDRNVKQSYQVSKNLIISDNQKKTENGEISISSGIFKDLTGSEKKNFRVAKLNRKENNNLLREAKLYLTFFTKFLIKFDGNLEAFDFCEFRERENSLSKFPNENELLQTLRESADDTITKQLSSIFETHLQNMVESKTLQKTYRIITRITIAHFADEKSKARITRDGIIRFTTDHPGPVTVCELIHDISDSKIIENTYRGQFLASKLIEHNKEREILRTSNRFEPMIVLAEDHNLERKNVLYSPQEQSVLQNESFIFLSFLRRFLYQYEKNLLELDFCQETSEHTQN